MRALSVLLLLIAGAVPAFAQRVRTERFKNRDVVSQEIIVRFRGTATADAIGRQVRAQDGDIASSTPIGRSGAVRLRARSRNVIELLKDYSSRPDVLFAEPNFIWKASEVPNDTFFGEQWALQNTGQFIAQDGTSGADIRAVQAWDVTDGSRRIVVGMIDSGIDYTHPDLVNNVWSAPSAFTVTIDGVTIQCAAGTHGFNAITRTCDPMDNDGHGTHTAGIVGASGHNTVGVSGVSRVASMLALKFLDDTGTGTTADAIAAIEFAIQLKQRFPVAADVRVLNASWGGPDPSQALLAEINLAGTNGMLFIAAAGNSSFNTDTTPEYPASLNAANIISVAATDNRDQLADFSNRGAATVHLGAPGVEILSTLRESFYGRASGTSMSAAVVSGAASLILSACEQDTASLKTAILSSVDAIPALAGLTTTGGRLNVNRAIRDCAGVSPTSFTLSVTPTNQTIAFGTGNQFIASLIPLNGFSGVVSFSATNVPDGMTANFAPASTSSGSTTLSIDLSPSIAQGTYFIGIVATGGGVTRNTGFIVSAGLPNQCVIDLSVGFVKGTLVSTDAASIHRPPAFADYCTFTLDSDRALTFQMNGGGDAFLYLLSSGGAVLASDDNSGSGSNAETSAELGAGTYTLEATTAQASQTGAYTLFVKSTRPFITSMSPNSGTQGTSVDVTITGTAFIGSPFNVKVTGCPGVVVSNLQRIDAGTVKARLALPNNTGRCDVSVSNPGGESDSRTFTINPLAPVITGISNNTGIQGQTVAVTLTGTNFAFFPQVTFNNFPLTPTSVTSTSISVDVPISINLPPGTYYVQVVTTGGTTRVPFVVQLAPPVLTSIFPDGGGPGLSVQVSFHGFSFVTPQINAGPRITVTDIATPEIFSLNATLTIAPDAPYGDYPISVTTAAGTSGTVIFKVQPPPVITSFTPARAIVGRSNGINLTGTNFVCPLRVIAGADIVGSSSCTSSTSASIGMQVSSGAALGPRTVRLDTPNGLSNPISIDIVPVPASIFSISPLYSAVGTIATVTITGSGLTSGIVDVSGGGIQATTLSSSDTKLTASLVIDANTAIGRRDLTVTTSQGVSDPVGFTVTPPTWPDLTVTQAPLPELASGYDATLSIIVRNVGTKATTAPITVVDEMSGTTFVSANPGWTCTAAGKFVTCTIPQSIPANSELAFQLVARISDGNGATFNKVTVQSPEDYNDSNNSSTITIFFSALGTPKITLSSSTMQPGQQGTISLTLSKLVGQEVSDVLDTLTMTFTPGPGGGAADPAAQFATGGNSVSYSFKANSLNADFAGVSGPIGFQAGTIAGTLTFKVTFRSRTGQTSSTSVNVTVASASPTIKDLTSSKSSSGFETAFTLISSTREVRTLSFQFNTTTPVRLSCGGVAGCSASGTTISFNVASQFNAWYASNPATGSLAMLRVPFTIQGTIAGSITVTLTNSIGNSNTMNFVIP